MAPEKTQTAGTKRKPEEEPTSNEIPVRDVNQLYCNAETAACAMKLCVPCAYKIGNFDIAFDKSFNTLAPNQRPESCPRIKEPPASTLDRVGIMGYRPGMNVLTCGDGDFSFSLAVARLLEVDESSPSKLVATSYEMQDTLADVYPDFKDTIMELSDLGSQVFYTIDATKLEQTLPEEIQGMKFDRIVWNFPCTAVARGQDGQNEAMEENKDLVRRFVNNARKYLSVGGEIHICHKTKPPFNQWKLEEVVVDACENGPEYSYLGRIVLDRASVPPYTPRKALDKKSFPCHDACVYIFGLNSNGNKKGKFISTIHADNDKVEAVTEKLVAKVRAAHVVKARHAAYGKDRKQRSRKKARNN
jgi:25S rRNA (uracil2634-N3)-methyltransferase